MGWLVGNVDFQFRVLLYSLFTMIACFTPPPESPGELSNRLHNEGHMTISYVTIPVIAVTHGVFWRHSLSKLLHIIRTVHC